MLVIMRQPEKQRYSACKKVFRYNISSPHARGNSRCNSYNFHRSVQWLLLYVPFWLETIHQQITQLVRTEKPDQIAIERIKLLRDAIVLGSRDTNLMPEVQAELNILLCHALTNTTRSEDIYLDKKRK